MSARVGVFLYAGGFVCECVFELCFSVLGGFVCKAVSDSGCVFERLSFLLLE